MMLNQSELILPTSAPPTVQNNNTSPISSTTSTNTLYSNSFVAPFPNNATTATSPQSSNQKLIFPYPIITSLSSVTSSNIYSIANIPTTNSTSASSPRYDQISTIPSSSPQNAYPSASPTNLINLSIVF